MNVHMKTAEKHQTVENMVIIRRFSAFFRTFASMVWGQFPYTHGKAGT